MIEREDVNPDWADNNGQMPLLCAAVLKGCDEAVKLLLEWEDVSHDRWDNGGRGPLMWATLNGHKGLVKLPLEKENG